jgi:hypothetical protein
VISSPLLAGTKKASSLSATTESNFYAHIS